MLVTWSLNIIYNISSTNHNSNITKKSTHHSMLYTTLHSYTTNHNNDDVNDVDDDFTAAYITNYY